MNRMDGMSASSVVHLAADLGCCDPVNNVLLLLCACHLVDSKDFCWDLSDRINADRKCIAAMIRSML